MTAGATLILRHVVVATELAQQEEAHGDSTEKVKWYPPYKHGGSQAGRSQTGSPAQAGSPEAGSTPQHSTETGSPAEAGSSQTGSPAQAGRSPQASSTPQAGSTRQVAVGTDEGLPRDGVVRVALPREGRIFCTWLVTLTRESLVERAGALSRRKLDQLANALRLAGIE